VTGSLDLIGRDLNLTCQRDMSDDQNMGFSVSMGIGEENFSIGPTLTYKLKEDAHFIWSTNIN